MLLLENMIYIYALAFTGGIVGAGLGLTPSFIVYGILGLGGILGQSYFLNNDILGVFAVPASCFAGSVASLAFAARTPKYRIVGTLGFKSICCTVNPLVYLVGGAAGAVGYWMMNAFSSMGFPADCGAVSIVISALFVRVVIGRAGILSCRAQYIARLAKHLWVYLPNALILPGVLGFISALVVYETQYVFLCFYLSAASLLFLQADGDFPVTHHITLTASYAASVAAEPAVGIIAAIVAAIIAQILFESARVLMNYGQVYESEDDPQTMASHIDPPACAIAALSFMIFMIGK